MSSQNKRLSVMSNNSASVRQKSFEAQIPPVDDNSSSSSSLYTALENESLLRTRTEIPVPTKHNPKNTTAQVTRTSSLVRKGSRGHRYQVRKLPYEGPLFEGPKYKYFLFKTHKWPKSKGNYSSKKELEAKMEPFTRSRSVQNDMLPRSLLKFGFNISQDSLHQYYGVRPKPTARPVSSRKKPRFVFRWKRKSRASRNQRKQIIKNTIRKLSHEDVRVPPHIKNLVEIKKTSSDLSNEEQNRIVDDNSSQYSVQLVTNSKVASSPVMEPQMKNVSNASILLQLLRLNPELRSQVKCTELDRYLNLVLKAPGSELETFQTNGLNYGVRKRVSVASEAKRASVVSEFRVPARHPDRKPSPPKIVENVALSGSIVPQTLTSPVKPTTNYDSPITYDFKELPRRGPGSRKEMSIREDLDSNASVLGANRGFVRKSTVSASTEGEVFYTPPIFQGSSLPRVSDDAIDGSVAEHNAKVRQQRQIQSANEASHVVHSAALKDTAAAATAALASSSSGKGTTPSEVNSVSNQIFAREYSPEIEVVPIGIAHDYEKKKKRKSGVRNSIDDSLKNAYMLEKQSLMEHARSVKKANSARHRSSILGLFSGGRAGLRGNKSNRSSVISQNSRKRSSVNDIAPVASAGLKIVDVPSKELPPLPAMPDVEGSGTVVGSAAAVAATVASSAAVIAAASYAPDSSVSTTAVASNKPNTANTTHIPTPKFEPLMNASKVVSDIESNSVHSRTSPQKSASSRRKSNDLQLQITNISAEEYKRYSDIYEQNKDKVINPDYLISDKEEEELQKELNSFNPLKIQEMIQAKLATESGLVVPPPVIPVHQRRLSNGSSSSSSSKEKFYVRRTFMDTQKKLDEKESSTENLKRNSGQSLLPSPSPALYGALSGLSPIPATMLSTSTVSGIIKHDSSVSSAADRLHFHQKQESPVASPVVAPVNASAFSPASGFSPTAGFSTAAASKPMASSEPVTIGRNSSVVSYVSTVQSTGSNYVNGEDESSGDSEKKQSYEMWGQYMKRIINQRISYRLQNSLLTDENEANEKMQVARSISMSSNHSFVTAHSEIDSLVQETLDRTRNVQKLPLNYKKNSSTGSDSPSNIDTSTAVLSPPDRAYGFRGSPSYLSESEKSSSSGSKRFQGEVALNLGAISEHGSPIPARSDSYSDKSNSGRSKRSDSVSIRSMIGNNEIKVSLTRNPNRHALGPNYSLGDLSHSSVNVSFRNGSRDGSIKSRKSHSQLSTRSSASSIMLRTG